MDNHQKGQVPEAAIDRTVPAHAAAVPSNDTRHCLAASLLADGPQTWVESWGKHELQISSAACPPLLHTLVSELSECGDPKCGCHRLHCPTARQDFQRLVVRRLGEALRGRSPATVRVVAVGAGMCLTEYEVLLRLWRDGLTIESFIAIDPVYSGLRAEDRNHRAIMQLATFFGGTRVHTFVDCAAFVAAASLEPELYGSADCVLYCDAAAVPPEAVQDVAAAALRPSTGLLFELTNLGAHHDGETPKSVQIRRGHKNYRLGCFQRTSVVLKPRPYSNQLALEWVPDELANDRTQAGPLEQLRVEAAMREYLAEKEDEQALEFFL